MPRKTAEPVVDPATGNPQLFGNKYRAYLINFVEDHSRRLQMPDSTISRRAFGGSDSMFIKRLRTGENLMLEKMIRLEVYLEKNRRFDHRDMQTQKPPTKAEKRASA